jgi:hypothetical protein
LVREYAEQRGEALYVAGTRVSLASVVHHFRLGASLAAEQQKWKEFKDSADAPPRGLLRGVEPARPPG